MVIEFQKAEDVRPADFKPHPLADLFPMMDDDAFLDFAQDIEKHGQREPIIIYENKILDGRNRYKACQMLGFSPRFKEYNGSDALGFVISLNLKRRHLTESQRSMVAGKLANLGKGNLSKSANLPISPVSQPDAAKMLNVSERSVRTAKQVQKSGVPELVKAVEEGAVSVSAAAVIAKQTPEKQAEILSPKDEKVIASAVKELKEAQNLYDRTVAAKEAYGSPEPLTEEDMEALAEAVGTPAERSVVMSVLGIGEQVAELPLPSVFIDQIPPAFERTINDEINSLEGVLNWFDAFLKAWKAKE
ncbi:ParB N-terminal domain-containing protein [Rhizobium pusense]|uniref:ParB/RepB/Spo0J family partition protein n=1 Tax=Agrobacterium pusense TaxID=648995 RepID=UPI0024470F2A|nr:ParB N-terminal domain-containing protein [Agrobacterium pusense]MDH2092312.1 ParB N-terminal domain-containing protein [Agrobacterium pusense]